EPGARQSILDEPAAQDSDMVADATSDVPVPASAADEFMAVADGAHPVADDDKLPPAAGIVPSPDGATVAAKPDVVADRPSVEAASATKPAEGVPSPVSAAVETPVTAQAATPPVPFTTPLISADDAATPTAGGKADAASSDGSAT